MARQNLLKESSCPILEEGKTVGSIVSMRRKSIQDPSPEALEPQAFIYSRPFKCFFYSVVMLNALTLGLRLDLVPDHNVWTVSEHIFTSLFLLEFLLKLYCLKTAYFRDLWNLLDFLIVITGILDAWILGPILGQSGGMMRMFAFFRGLRLVKMLKMKQELVTLVHGIFDSLQSMAWIAILLVGVIYVFAIFFTALIRDEQYSEPNSGAPKKYFGSLTRTMLTLFNIAILDEWNAIVRPVYLNQIWLIPFFLLFLILTAFSLMNAIVGIIVERTTNAAQDMADSCKEAVTRERFSKGDALWKLVESMDADHDHSISCADVAKSWADEVKREKLQALLDDMQMPDFFTLEDVHTLLDLEATGFVTEENFVVGLTRLVKNNPFHDMCLDQLTMGKIRRQVKHLGTRIDENKKQMKLIMGELGAIRDHLNIPCPKAAHMRVMPDVSKVNSAVTEFSGEVLQLPSLQVLENKKHLSGKIGNAIRRSKSEGRPKNESLRSNGGAAEAEVCVKATNVAHNHQDTIFQLRAEIDILKAELDTTRHQLSLHSRTNRKTMKKSFEKGVSAQSRTHRATHDQSDLKKAVEQRRLPFPNTRTGHQQNNLCEDAETPSLPSMESFISRE